MLLHNISVKSLAAIVLLSTSMALAPSGASIAGLAIVPSDPEKR
jgi:hypothetical protein